MSADDALRRWKIVGEAASGAAGFSVIAGSGQATRRAYLRDGDVGADDVGLQYALRGLPRLSGRVDQTTPLRAGL